MIINTSKKVLLSFMISCIGVGVAHAEDKKYNSNRIQIRIAVNDDIDGSKAKFVKQFKSNVESRTQGRVFVEMSDVRDKTEQEAVQMGNIEMFFPSFAKIDTKEFDIFNVPYLLNNNATKVSNVLSSEDVIESLSVGSEKKYLKVLGLGFEGFSQVMTDKQVKKVAEFKGMKFFSNSENEIKTLNSIGMVSVPDKNIDGLNLVSGSSVFLKKTKEKNTKFTDIYETNHNVSGYVVAINSTFWKRVPDVYKDIIKDSVKTVLYPINLEKIQVASTKKSFSDSEKELVNSFLAQRKPVAEKYLSIKNTNNINVFKSYMMAQEGQPAQPIQKPVAQPTQPATAQPATATAVAPKK